jgi:DNA-binding response OmpR family regulator
MTKVLICDDQPALRELARAALAEGDYVVFEAADGAEAVRLALEVRPDVIVLDMVLPDQSGLDVVVELRQQPGLASTPVLLCTARDVRLGGDDGRGFGVDGYLPKPFRPSELAAAVQDLVAS